VCALTDEGLAIRAGEAEDRGMRRLLWLAPIAMFFLNPNVACVDEPEFQYGAEEMRAAVEGDWSFTITPTGGTATELTVHIEQGTAPATAQSSGSAFVRAAHACGDRTLVKSAAACIDLTKMPLAVTYVSGDAAFASARLAGNFTVYGLTFGVGDLALDLGSYIFRAGVSADGTVTVPEIFTPDGATVVVNRL
jgi:hypothetical protein